MQIYQTAHYQVKEEAVEEVKEAIARFVIYIKANEPGTRMYKAWQNKEDPTKFVHLFIFENDMAQDLHSKSHAVKKFESVYSPVLISGPVIFTDYITVAEN
jgi:quinol monooxygenase YgiN